MMDNVQFTDEQLTAYLDGEATVELCDQIETALETDDALGMQLAALDIPVAEIAQAYDALLLQAPPMLPPPTPMQRPSRLSVGIWGMVGLFGTGIAAGLATAMITGVGAPPPPQPGWKAVVASYQSLYSSDTLADDDSSPTEMQAQLAQVSQLVGADLTKLPQVDGLTFKRAQVLGFKGKPLVQLAFVRSDGTPVALCIIKAKTKDSKPINSEELSGMAAASWNSDGLAYLLIGGTEAPSTQSEAEAFEIWSTTVADI
jgi:anti-sigma factor RsiW